MRTEGRRLRRSALLRARVPRLVSRTLMRALRVAWAARLAREHPEPPPPIRRVPPGGDGAGLVTAGVGDGAAQAQHALAALDAGAQPWGDGVGGRTQGREDAGLRDRRRSASGPAAAGRIGVDPKDLALVCREVLGVVELGVLAAAVAGRDPQAAIGSEVKLSSVVVAGARMLDHEQPPSAGRVGLRWIGRRPRELVDSDVAVEVRVVDVYVAGALVVGRRGNREEAPLATDAHERGDIEVRARLGLAVDDQPDAAAQLADEQAAGVARHGGDCDRLSPWSADRLSGEQARARPGSETDNAPSESGRVEATHRILAEGGELGNARPSGSVVGIRRVEPQRPDGAAGEVGKEGATAEPRERAVAHDETGRDDAAARVHVIEERLGGVRHGAAGTARTGHLALPARPAEVRAAGSGRPIQSTSSRRAPPTSPISRSPVSRSNVKRYGLRRPYA